MATSLSNGKLFGGIDPGKDGFFALYDGLDIVGVEPMPQIKGSNALDIDGIATIFEKWASLKVNFVILEEQRAMPREGAVGAFSLGHGFGLLRMGLRMVGLRHEIISPGKWKKSLGLKAPAKKKAPKDASDAEKRRIRNEHKSLLKAISIEAAQAMFPKLDLRRSNKCRGPDHNKAEACLISALSYRRHGWL